MGLFSFLEDVPIVGDVIDFGQNLFGGDGLFSSGGSLGNAFDIGGTIKDILGAVKPFTSDLVGAGTAYGAYEAQKAANETNVQLADKATSFNAEQAALNRDFQSAQAGRQMDFQSAQTAQQMAFQERMAGSSYQRARADLEKAGINPMLALMKGGADSPGGASASGASGSGSSASAMLAKVENALAPAINSGNIASRVSQELQNMKIQNSNLEKQGRQIDATTELLKAQVPNVMQQTQTGMASAANLRSQNELAQENANKARAEVDRILDERKRIHADTALKEFDLKHTQPALLRMVQSQTRLSELQQPAASNAAEAQDSWWMKNVAPYLPSILQGQSAAGGAAGLIRWPGSK